MFGRSGISVLSATWIGRRLILTDVVVEFIVGSVRRRLAERETVAVGRSDCELAHAPRLFSGWLQDLGASVDGDRIRRRRGR